MGLALKETYLLGLPIQILSNSQERNFFLYATETSNNQESEKITMDTLSMRTLVLNIRSSLDKTDAEIYGDC